MAVDHYENFPVASLLLPRHLRAAVRDVYRFARTADDIADEGTLAASQRLTRLAQYRAALQAIADGHGVQDALAEEDAALARVFVPLAHTIRTHALPVAPFADLLSAFEQDVVKTRYRDDDELFDYCRRSANPVGRIMLHLYGAADAQNLPAADAVCTGLQLTNFWQDIGPDWAKGRVYIPLDKLDRAGLDVSDIARHAQRRGPMPPDVRWHDLMRAQVAQARDLLHSGLPLTRRLRGRFGLELRLMILGGLRILEHLDDLHYDMFLHRPTLGKRDWLLLAWRCATHAGSAPAAPSPLRHDS